MAQPAVTAQQQEGLILEQLELGQSPSDTQSTTHATAGAENLDDVSIAYPEGGFQAWLVVFGSFCMITATYGTMAGIGVFQSYLEQHQLVKYSTNSVSWITSMFVFLNLSLGLQVGPLCDRYGTRWIMIIGSVIWSAAIIVLANCTKYWQFMLVLSVCGGIGSTMISNPTVSALSQWFNRKRGAATGIAFVGSSAGGITFPLMMKTLFPLYGWTWSIRIFGFVIIGLLVVGNLCIKSRITTPSQSGSIDMRCFMDKRFNFLVLGVTCFEIVLFGSLALIPTYATVAGFSTQTGSYLLACLNAGSSFGRGIPGFLSDKYGRFNTVIVMLILSIIAVFIVWYPFGHNIPAMYVFVTIFGFGTGSAVSLAPVCIGQLCSTREYGRWFGTTYCVVGFGILIFVPIAGQFLEQYGAKALILFWGGVLALAFGGFIMARLACLDYKWKWQVKV